MAFTGVELNPATGDVINYSYTRKSAALHYIPITKQYPTQERTVNSLCARTPVTANLLAAYA